MTGSPGSGGQPHVTQTARPDNLGVIGPLIA